MPKFIGNEIKGATRISDNHPGPEGYIRLSYAQARLLPPEQVLCSLDTTDRGSRKCYAKRWFRWFAHRNHVWACPRSTQAMRSKAVTPLPKYDGFTRVQEAITKHTPQARAYGSALRQALADGPQREPILEGEADQRIREGIARRAQTFGGDP